MLERSQSNGISFLRAGWPSPNRPLVLVHGIGSNAQSFAAVMESASPHAARSGMGRTRLRHLDAA